MRRQRNCRGQLSNGCWSTWAKCSVASWWDSPYFTEAERAALALAEAVLQPGTPGQERIPDQLYAQAADGALARLDTVTLASASACDRGQAKIAAVHRERGSPCALVMAV